jgi:hypothetical protein
MLRLTEESLRFGARTSTTQRTECAKGGMKRSALGAYDAEPVGRLPRTRKEFLQKIQENVLFSKKSLTRKTGY